MNIAPHDKTFVPLHMLCLFLKIAISLASFPDQIKFMKCGHVQPISFHKMTIFINMSALKKLSICDQFKNIQNLVMGDQFSVNKMMILNNIAPYKILDPCKRCFPL